MVAAGYAGAVGAFTVCAKVACIAVAREGIGPIDTGTVAAAGHSGTVIRCALATGSRVARVALTSIAIDAINAATVTATRYVQAIVDVCFAIGAAVASTALARIARARRSAGAVLARLTCARVRGRTAGSCTARRWHAAR